ncbi:MAG: GMC family oxidoreductase [Sphingobacteriales bacterium]|nr:GMC family oxidoreductase [Sphingobacteriales bacterium]
MKKSLSRRKFIGLSAAAGLASTLPLSGCSKAEVIPSVNDYEAIVIGSGFGASVSALRLTKAGKKTLMLEMGKEYDINPSKEVFTKTLNPDGRSFWLKRKTAAPVTTIQFDIPKYVGVLDKVSFPTSYMNIYRGTCLGGGSVVYGAMLPYAQPSMWNEYFPFVEYSEMTDKWYPKVKSILNFSEVPDDILNSKYYKYARVGLSHCEKAGMDKVMLNAGVDFTIIRGEMNGTEKKSSLGGELLYGSNNGYKNSLDRNYIPAAKATGNLTIETLHKVDFVKQLPDGRYEVNVLKINEQGDTEYTKIYTCKHLFVNAGVVGTMQILLKSKYLGGLVNLNDEVGKHWGNNGNVMAMRVLLNEETGADQCIVPVTAYGDLNNPVAPLLAEQAPFPIGMELKQLLTLAITKNPNRGYFKYNPATDNAELYFDSSQMELSRRAMGNFIDRLNAANGGSLDRLFYFNGKGFGDDFTYHPLGGAVLGLASDTYGRLKGYENLYCLDGSMMPGFSCCANPALTIAALAERAMENIIAEDFV